MRALHAAFNYLRANLADPATHRLYQDHGTTELDANYAPYQLLVNDLARERGYEDGKNFETRVFEGTSHSRAGGSRCTGRHHPTRCAGRH